MSRLVAALTGAALLSVAPVVAAGWTPAPESPVARAGEAVVYFADQDLLKANRGSFNPFEIDREAMLQHVGLFFVVVDFDGEGVHEGEMAIYPQFRTPQEMMAPSAATPAAIYFAFKKNGSCHGGYVSGHPIPEHTFEVDMAGQVCHADAVERMLLADYRTIERGRAEANAAITAAGGTPAPEPEPDVPLTETAVVNFNPAFPTDLDLKVIAWAAYNAAYARAEANGGTFAGTEDERAALGREIRHEILAEGFKGVTLSDNSETPPGGSCALPGKTELRFTVTNEGRGIEIAAVSDRRMAGKIYDPDISDDMNEIDPRACATIGLARAGIDRY